jgi:predicted TIM-barrel fold metal-dependent hydrolase
VPYVKSGIVHDADAHVMESPDWLQRHADPGLRDRVPSLWMAGNAAFAAKALRTVRRYAADDDERARAEEELLRRKNWWALGAHDPSDRARAIDLLGFSSQLVFATHSRAMLVNQPGAPPTADFQPDVLYGCAVAYNRAVAEFCAVDTRLLAVGIVPLDVPDRAIATAAGAIALGCRAIEVPTYPVGPHSISHTCLDPFYRLLEDSGRPLVFHIGSGGQVPSPVFADNGLPPVHDEHGNLEPLRRLRVVGTPGPVELALGALIFDGVLQRHPRLMVGVMEHGATWVPGFLRRLDLAVRLDNQMSGQAGGQVGDHGDSGRQLDALPSEFVRRQVRFTPFPLEPVGWLIDQSGPELFMFSSDYPHVEGGEAPLEAFAESLGHRPDAVLDRFYRRNFEELMGGVPGVAPPG